LRLWRMIWKPCPLQLDWAVRPAELFGRISGRASALWPFWFPPHYLVWALDRRCWSMKARPWLLSLMRCVSWGIKIAAF